MAKLTVVVAIAFAIMVPTQANIVQDIALGVIRKGCELKENPDQALLERLRAGDYTMNDRNIVEYSYCVYRSLFIANEDGSINKTIGSLLIKGTKTDPDKFSAAVDACAGETGSDPKDKLFNGLRCYDKQYPGDIFAL